MRLIFRIRVLGLWGFRVPRHRLTPTRKPVTRGYNQSSNPIDLKTEHEKQPDTDSAQRPQDDIYVSRPRLCQGWEVPDS